MTKKSVIRCILAILLMIYIGVMVVVANQALGSMKCSGFDVRIIQTDDTRDFVTKAEILRLLKEWKLDDINRPVGNINLQKIEDKLNAIDNIESASVELMPDRKIRLTITPMIPVARVFESNGKSYYINRRGKRLTANARYRLDVPVISADFNDSVLPPSALIPLVETLHNDKNWRAITSQILVETASNDIILVPLIRGHVINLGDTANIPDKLNRVMAMYRKVMPKKGWEFYDTISVKWAGQIVATRRKKELPPPAIFFDQEGDVEEESVDAMLVADTVAKPQLMN